MNGTFFLVGTYLIQGRKSNNVIDEALAAGYRLFDSAHMYNNEHDLGKAFKDLLAKHNLARGDIFITTKFGEFHCLNPQRSKKFIFSSSSSIY
jgi:2,5-diketo-D-gluconate reductase A